MGREGAPVWERAKALFGIGREKKGQPREATAIEDLGDALQVRVVCRRCREEITARLRKSSDIQPNYDGGDFAYFVQKTLVGKECFNRIEVRLEFDARYRLIASTVHGGELLRPEQNA